MSHDATNEGGVHIAREEQRMSRLHRAMEKAEREGLLTLTAVGDGRGGFAPATETSIAELRDDPDVEFLKPLAPDAAAIDALPESMPALQGRLGPMLVVATRPGSPVAERYRLLRTRLEEVRKPGNSQLLLVTSPGIGDGKTTTGANLALTMAQEFRQHVVLVDADLRRASLAAQFGIRPEPGLADVLMGAAPLDDALVQIDGQSLYVLPAGAPPAQSKELLASTMMQRLLTTLRARFSRIVVDAPPVDLADSHVLARLADGVLIVVRAGVTTRPAVERAFAGVDRERLIGVVLNDVDETPREYAYCRPVAGVAG